MTASEIAETVGVSQPAVTRFVTNVLNFQGFSQFIKCIQDIIRYEVTGIERYQITSHKSTSAFEKLIKQEIDNLNNLLEDTTDEKLNQIVSVITNKKTIFLIGFRTAAPIVNYFFFFLRKIHPDVRICTHGGSEVYDTLHHMDRESTLIITFIFPRYPTETINIIHYIQQENFQSIAISDSFKLKEARICDIDIVTPIIINTLFDSYTSTFFMLNILLDKIARNNFAQTKEMLSTLEDMYHKNQIFYKRNN